jgi:hypothetical protein
LASHPCKMTSSECTRTALLDTYLKSCCRCQSRRVQTFSYQHLLTAAYVCVWLRWGLKVPAPAPYMPVVQVHGLMALPGWASVVWAAAQMRCLYAAVIGGGGAPSMLVVTTWCLAQLLLPRLLHMYMVVSARRSQSGALQRSRPAQPAHAPLTKAKQLPSHASSDAEGDCSSGRGQPSGVATGGKSSCTAVSSLANSHTMCIRPINLTTYRWRSMCLPLSTDAAARATPEAGTATGIVTRAETVAPARGVAGALPSAVQGMAP